MRPTGGAFCVNLLASCHLFPTYSVPTCTGDIVLLRPTPEGPNELARFPVFDEKTWNPIALSGDLLVVRSDREAASIRLPLGKKVISD